MADVSSRGGHIALIASGGSNRSAGDGNTTAAADIMAAADAGSPLAAGGVNRTALN